MADIATQLNIKKSSDVRENKAILEKLATAVSVAATMKDFGRSAPTATRNDRSGATKTPEGKQKPFRQYMANDVH